MTVGYIFADIADRHNSVVFTWGNIPFHESEGSAKATLVVSPNGRWAAWENFDYSRGMGGGAFCGHLFASLDGKHCADWNLDRHARRVGIWLNDSTHWATQVANLKDLTLDRIVVGTVNTPEQMQTYNLPKSCSLRNGDLTLLYGDCIGESSLRFLAWKPQTTSIASLSLVEAKLGQGAYEDRKWAIDSGDRGQIMNVVVSPEGQRIAWVVWTERQPPIYNILRRILRIDALRPKSVATIWVSKLDGTDRHEIGWIDVGPVLPTPNVIPSQQPDRLPQQLAWTPDGKDLSYIVDDNLWMVSVP
jgi:hypothetical protein